eukprot:g1580.t1
MGAGSSSAVQELRAVAIGYDERSSEGAEEQELRALMQPTISRLKGQAQRFRLRRPQSIKQVVPGFEEEDDDEQEGPPPQSASVPTKGDYKDAQHSAVSEQTASAEEERSVGLPAYLDWVVRANASIKDSLSGEPLDIDTQCVCVTVVSSTSGDATAVEAIEYMRGRLQTGRALEPKERVLVQPDKSQTLTWVEGVIEEVQANVCIVQLNNLPFSLTDAAAQAAFDRWVQEGARKSAFESVAQLAAADLELVLELHPQQHSNRTINGVKMACERDCEIVLHFATLHIRAAINPEKDKQRQKSRPHFYLQRVVQPVPRSSLRLQPVLLTGPAACGKSTFTKQYLHHSASSKDAARSGMVPVLVPVIELAKTMKEQDLMGDADADILQAHLNVRHTSNAPLLLQLRSECRLVVLLDGMDEAGDCRETLERYVSCRLATEVQLCVTGREQGIKAMHLFDRFIHVQVQPLTEEQQGQVIEGRFKGKLLEGATAEERITAFTKQLRGNVSFVELAKNPLLLNLLVSEYMQHERVGGDDNIYFKGRCVKGQKEYVGSFPGQCKREWDRVTQVMEDRSVACVFIPEEDQQYGEHDDDPDHPGKCFCESYLYHDAPEEVQRKNLEFIMDDANMHVDETLPKVGQKIEARVKVPKWDEAKWWVCTVQEVETERIFASFDGLGRALKPAWVSIEKINQTGERHTTQRAKQAPFGCRWYAEWTKKVAECEAEEQKAVVVYKKGKRGIKTFEGLGASQLKEVAYLETRFYPKKDYIEVDATEFEAQNTMNRAQVYKSAIEGMIRQHSGSGSDDGGNSGTQIGRLLRFMQELAFGLHTQEGSQFRNFDTALVQRLLASSTAAAQREEELEAVWTDELLPAVCDSRFPLVVWEPEGTNDVFRVSHLSFQEYLCASRLVLKMQQQKGSNPAAVCKTFVQKAGLQTIESLVGSDRFQVIVQMGRELLAGDEALAEEYASCFLPEPDEDGAIHVGSNLATATAAITLFGLISCRRDTGIALRLAKCGLNADAIGGWESSLRQYTCKSVTSIDVSNNDLSVSGAQALQRLLALHGKNMLQANGGKALAPGLKGNQAITELNIASNYLGVQDSEDNSDMSGVIAIGNAIPTMGALTSLDFSNNSIGGLVLPEGWEEQEEDEDHDWEPWYKRIDGQEQTQHPGQPEGVIAIANAIPTMGALVKFDISKNEIRAEGGKALAEALKNNQVMTELNISDNLLSRNTGRNADLSGVIAIGDAIPTMGALTSLDISTNNLGGYWTDGKWISDMTGINALAAAIPACKALTSLNISSNSLGGYDDFSKGYREWISDMTGIKALAAAIPECKALTSLDISDQVGRYGDGGIGAEGAKHIAEAIKGHTYINDQKVQRFKPPGGDWSDTAPTDAKPEGVIALADGIKNNGALMSLNLANNELGAEGAKCIAEAIEVNVSALPFFWCHSNVDLTSLTKLDISNNDIEQQGEALQLIAELCSAKGIELDHHES